MTGHSLIARRRARETWAALSALLVVLAARPSPAQQWPVTTFTPDDGLAGSQLWDLLQDSRGYLWVGTSTGISRYDGVSFVGFTAADGLHNQVVRTIVEDQRGWLWFGTHDGVARFDGRSFTAFTSRQGLGRGVVWASARDRWGGLWFGTSEGGVSLVRGEDVRTFTRADGLAHDYVYALRCDSRDRLWLGHRGAGVTRCQIAPDGRLSDCAHFGRADGLAHDDVRAIAEDAGGNLFFGTRGGGVSRFDGTRFTGLTTAHGLASDDVYALLINHRGELVVGTHAGVSLCDLPEMRTCRSLSTENGLRDGVVHALLEDREHVLWIALNNGLARLLTESLRSTTPRDGLPDAKVYAVLPGEGDDLWVGTYGGLARVRPDPTGRDRQELAVWTAKNGLPANWVWDVVRDGEGQMWVGTTAGLCRFSPERGCSEVLTTKDGLPADQVLALLASRAGDLWVGTSGGLAQIALQSPRVRPSVRSFRVADGLAGSAANRLAEDRLGRIWVGSTGQGVSVYDGTAFRVLTAADGLPANAVLGLMVGGDGTVWIGTNGGGLAMLPPDPDLARPRFAAFGPERGVPAMVDSFAEDPSGRVWVGTSRGVVLFDPDAAWSGEVPGRGRLDRESGLPSSEVHALATDRRNRLWIGLSEGLTRFDQALQEPPGPPPSTTIERVTSSQGRSRNGPFTPLAGRPSDGDDPLADTALVLPHDDTGVRFDFRVLSFRPRESKVDVRLQGFERDWVGAGDVRFREYTNLDPGSYVFQVRAAGRDGRWSAPAELRLVVTPAFWQTWPFAVVVALAFGLALAAAHLLRTRRIRARTRQLEAVVAERTDDLSRYARALEQHAHALEQANLRIRKAERAKSEFLANMSHELRTPLNSIIGFADLLLERSVDPDRQRKFLSNVRWSGDHLLQLINNLLDASKIEAGKMAVELQETPLDPILEGVCSVMQGYCAQRHVAVERRPVAGPSLVVVDVAKLRQILLNLLSNAVKFSPPGGVVELSGRHVPASASPLGVESYELAVADQGIGIRPEDQAAIFEDFRQIHTDGTRPAGSGLGLAIVRRFVAMLGGRVSVASAHGAGSTFRVLLPVDASAAVSAEPDAAVFLPAVELVSRTAVVLEDDRASFTAIAAALEREGVLVVPAHGPADATRMAREIHPAVIVVDLLLPELRGWPALAALATDEAMQDIPVLVLCRLPSGSLGLALGIDRCAGQGAEGGHPEQGPVRAEGAAAGPTVDLTASQPNGFALLHRLQADPASAATPVTAILGGGHTPAERQELAARVSAACAEVGAPADLAHVMRLLIARRDARADHE
ncbi:MAG: two-component regulator propeller domain-containing protein [Thermoanaerobaculaceae bacterium]